MKNEKLMDLLKKNAPIVYHLVMAKKARKEQREKALVKNLHKK